MKLYILSDPRTDAVRYVGVTYEPLINRAHKHTYDRHRATSKGIWLAELYALGLRPLIKEIANVGTDWRERERSAIAAYREAGCDLVNISVGGEGHAGVTHTEATKRRISEAKKGKPFIAADPARRAARISASMAGKSKSTAHRAKISASLKGRMLVSEDRQHLVREMFASGKTRNAISIEIGMNFDTVVKVLAATPV